MNEQMLQELSQPFHPSQVVWKPGAIAKSKDKALALAYADLRAYQNRLDEVCGIDWSVSYTAWGERIICHLTIGGVTRSSTGEPTSESERGEISGTVAEAQAFKRACAMFGLGRYLYSLPQTWQPIDEYKKWTKEAEAKMVKLVNDHYARHTGKKAASNQSREDVQQLADSVGATITEKTDDSPLSKVNELGYKLYGEDWSRVADHNAKRIAGNDQAKLEDLAIEQLRTLYAGLQSLQKQKKAA